MAHFYSTVTSKNTTQTKCGYKDGISGHIRGWNVGAKIWISHNEETGRDEVTVYKTSGSNGAGSQEVIAEYSE